MADTRPNVLWICTDQQRWDTVRSPGNPHIRTPSVDRLPSPSGRGKRGDRARLRVYLRVSSTFGQCWLLALISASFAREGSGSTPLSILSYVLSLRPFTSWFAWRTAC